MKIASIILVLCAVIGGIYYYQNTKIVDLTKMETGKVEKDYWIIKHRDYFDTSKEVKQLDLSACIMLQFDINEEGKFENPVILSEQGGDLIKDALIESMEKWQWEPSPSNQERKPIRWMRYFSVGNDKSVTDKCFNFNPVKKN